VNARGSLRAGIHGLVLTGSQAVDDWQPVVELCSRLGYAIVEVPMLDPYAVDGKAMGALFAEHDLEPTASLGLTFATDVSSTDLAVVGAGKDLLHAALDTVADMGGDFLGGVIYSAMGKYPGPPTTGGRANAVAVLRDLAASADERGIALGIEAANRYETNLINTSGQAVSLIEDIGADNVVVHLDAYHVHIEEGDFGAAVRRCGDRLGYVHVGESHRGILGTGSIDLPAVFRALVQVGYDGTVTFESFSNAVVSESLSNALAIWRRLWDDGPAVAEHALAVMQSHWATAQLEWQANTSALRGR
jgi:D-psicose/D-tagatose/L-ribulose 3-epimerase